MGGRVQGPILGRFLSADPTIPYPESSQSFNRYSYGQNNPTSRIDPSGFTDRGFSLDEGREGNGGFIWIYILRGDLLVRSTLNGPPREPTNEELRRELSAAANSQPGADPFDVPQPYMSTGEGGDGTTDDWTFSSSVSIGGVIVTTTPGALGGAGTLPYPSTEDLPSRRTPEVKIGERAIFTIGARVFILIGGIFAPSELGDSTCSGNPGACKNVVFNESGEDPPADDEHSDDRKITTSIGKIASSTGLTPRDVRDRIHSAKERVPRSGPISNPNVGVDINSGEIYPELPDGGFSDDSLGNIFDEPGGFR